MGSLFMLKNRPRLFCGSAIFLSVLLNVVLLTNIFSKEKTLNQNYAWLHNGKVYESSMCGESNQSFSVLSELTPRPNSIFFVETSGAAALGAKQCCAIESTASKHCNEKYYPRKANISVQFQK